MITEDYVSFETAKLLKEKGFDKECRYVYNNEGKKIASEHFKEGKSFVDKIDIESVARYNGWNTYLQGDYAYLCPTLKEVKMWLKETFELDCQIEHPIVAFGWTYGIRNLYQNVWFSLRNMGVYETYEEACEAAIKYCLEKLI